MIVAKKQPLTQRRNETRDLTRPIEIAINHLVGVRVTRNNNLGPVVPYARRHEPGIRAIIAGLGDGSADLVGIVACTWPGVPDRRFGRAFALEVKWPEKKPRGDQVVWLRVIRSLGGFACVVSSIEEALAAVVRCRDGASE
jgi:hypothetical protein